MLAKVNGLFRLIRDMELVNTQSGTTIGKLGLVCSEKYKDKETTLFIDGICFGKTAEILSQYAGSKGTQIYLSGKLQTENWQDNNGQKRSKISMTIEGFDFVSNKNQSNNQQQQSCQPQQQQSYQAPAPTYQNAQKQQITQQQYQQNQQQQMPMQPPVIDIDEDGVPF